MTKTLFWFHDKALSHAALTAVSPESRALYIWDDTYFKTRGYSLKRLVFIYETLCEMDIEIIKGDTQKVLRTIAPDRVKTFQTEDSVINQMITKLQNDIDEEWGELIPVEGSSVMSKEEVEELNKIKLPF